MGRGSQAGNSMLLKEAQVEGDPSRLCTQDQTPTVLKAGWLTVQNEPLLHHDPGLQGPCTCHRAASH